MPSLGFRLLKLDAAILGGQETMRNQTLCAQSFDSRCEAMLGIIRMTDELNRLRHSKDEADRRKAIELLTAYLAQDSSSPEAWYAKAGCHDFLGEEKDAEPCYQRVYDLGWQRLAEPEQKSFLVGYGSTLRNNLKFEESARVLNEGISHFPDYPAFKAFLALTYYSMKNDRDAARTLFQALLQVQQHGFDGYERAIAWYVDNMDTYPEARKP